MGPNVRSMRATVDRPTIYELLAQAATIYDLRPLRGDDLRSTVAWCRSAAPIYDLRPPGGTDLRSTACWRHRSTIYGRQAPLRGTNLRSMATQRHRSTIYGLPAAPIYDLWPPGPGGTDLRSTARRELKIFGLKPMQKPKKRWRRRFFHIFFDDDVIIINRGTPL